MYVRELYIRNFRNFAETRVLFSNPLTAIVGPNSVGKSNIIAALRLLLDSQTTRQNRLLEQDDFNDPDSIAAGKEIIISATITDFEDNDKDKAFLSKWKPTRDTAVVTYRFRPNDQARADASERRTLIDQAKAEIAANPDSSIEVPEQWKFRLEDFDYDRIGGLTLQEGGGNAELSTVSPSETFGTDAEKQLNQFAYVEMPAIRDVVRDMALRRTSPLHRLIDLVTVPSDVKQRVEDAVRDANRAIQSDSFFSKIQSIIDSSYESLTAAPDPLTVRVGIADPTFSVVIRSIELLLSDPALTDADMSRNGLGYNNLLYVSILMEFFRQRSENRGNYQMLVIEEPEAHLHPNAQAALVRNLRQRQHQTIITSHSGTSIAAAGLETVVAISRRDGGSVATKLLDSLDLSEPERADLNRYLDLNRSSMLFARHVVLVEGLSEELLIHALAERHHINLGQQNVSIIVVAGTHFVLLARLIAMSGMNTSCHVVADGDAQNTRQWLGLRLPDRGDRIGPTSVESPHFYRCATTLEMALTQPENRQWIVDALKSLNAPRIADAVDRDLQSSDHARQQQAQLAVVRTARRIGKGRFAQALAHDIAQCQVVPEYLGSLLNVFTP